LLNLLFITVQGKDEIECFKKSNYIVSKVKLLSFDPFWGLGWIGLYSAKELDHQNYIQFYHLRSTQSEFTFGPLDQEVTEYEIRVFPKYSANIPILSKKISNLGYAE